MGLLWRAVKAAVSGFIANDALSRGASIAFYAATSLAPVLLIVVAIAGLAFGQDAARGAISEELGKLLGPTGADFIKSILARSSDPTSGATATAVGVVTVLMGSTPDGIEWDEAERLALGVLADSGLVPPLRLVPLGIPRRREAG